EAERELAGLARLVEVDAVGAGLELARCDAHEEAAARAERDGQSGRNHLDEIAADRKVERNHVALAELDDDGALSERDGRELAELRGADAQRLGRVGARREKHGGDWDGTRQRTHLGLPFYYYERSIFRRVKSRRTRASLHSAVAAEVRE